MMRNKRVDLISDMVKGLKIVKIEDINILEGVLVRKYENGSYMLGYLDANDKYIFYVYVMNNVIKGIGSKKWKNEILKAIELFEKC